MRTGSLLSAFAVVLAILVVGTAAAGLAASGGGGEGEASDEGFGIGEGSGGGLGDGDETGLSFGAAEEGESLVPSVFWTILVAGVVFGVVASVLLFLVMIWREGISWLLTMLRSVAGTVVAALILMAVLLGVFQLLAELQGDGGGGFLGGGSLPDSFVGEGGSAFTSPILDPPMALLIVGALVMVAVLVLVSKEALPSGDDEPSGAAVPPRQPDEPTASFPYDSTFTDVEPTNPVYRAWLTLANRVDGTDRRTSTPGEVAVAAIADGYDPDAVRTVTDLFAEVRYGRHPVDEDRAARARNARDVIENQSGST